MKTIGLIGGMSWESSAEYFRLINQDMKARLGGHGAACAGCGDAGARLSGSALP